MLRESFPGRISSQQAQGLCRGYPMSTLGDQVVWVTGGGTGIGRAGAVELARAGAMVVVSGRRPEMLDEAAAGIRANGGRVETVPLDVADAQAVETAAASILARFGQVDILVNS